MPKSRSFPRRRDFGLGPGERLGDGEASGAYPFFDVVAVGGVGPRITAVLQPVAVAGWGAALRAAELNLRFGGNTAYPPPPRCRSDTELNRAFRKNTQGGREGGAHIIPADAPLDLVDLGDGEADVGTDVDQPGGVAQNPRQHLPVGFHVAQI